MENNNTTADCAGVPRLGMVGGMRIIPNDLCSDFFLLWCRCSKKLETPEEYIKRCTPADAGKDGEG